MKRFFLFITLSTIFCQAFCQLDSSTIYKNLKTVTYYPLNLSAETYYGQSTTYEANGKEIDKSTYEKYHSSRENWNECCPCLVKSYNEHETLLSESISCGECYVGWLKVYYPTGGVKFIGSYKENPTGNWNNIPRRNYCNIKNGLWIYFEENGDTLYSELWNNGEFIKQNPEQNITEIWDIELSLNEQIIDTQTIAINQIGNLKITPKYKNNNTNSNLTIKFEVSANGHIVNNKSFSLNSFNSIDVSAMLLEVGIPKEKKTSYNLYVYNDNKHLIRYSLNVTK